MIKKEETKNLKIKSIDSNEHLTKGKQEIIAKIKKILPHVINSDNQLDTKALNDLLSAVNTSNNKGYELTFAGKGIARAKADSETEYELQTERKQSKDFNTTQNTVIRGDSLEVLKILKQNYFGKIKMIYIGPPYNTKSVNFIYNDNFKHNEEELIEHFGLEKDTTDFLHNVYGTRSHSGWLSFMYPRLKLARELLKDDGVIFISIDDNEQANLKIMCDEIFGGENFLIDLIRKTKSTTNDTREGINIQHENCLVYCKNRLNIKLFGGEKDLSRYKNPDNDPNGEWVSDNPSAKSGRGNQSNYFEIKNPYTGKVDFPSKGMHWKLSPNTIQKHIDKGTICFKKEHKENERGFIYKRYKNQLRTIQKTLDSLVFVDNQFMNQKATKNLLELKLAEYFTYPKGYEYIYKLIQHATNPTDLILDFFAGSGTTGDAVMQLNAEDGGKRKYILVQWDEAIKKDTKAHKFCTNNDFAPVISSICIERLNRAGKKIKKEWEAENKQEENKLIKEDKKPMPDIGYKVFSLTKKPKIAEQKNENQQNMFVIEYKRASTENTLINMLCATCKPLDSKIEVLIKGTLYKVDDEIYLLGSIEKEQLEPYKDCTITINGWCDINLESWLNLDVGNRENVGVVY